ncbi:MAG TPA: glycoside hydrolase family 2 TIM barrel-domain containing protein [Gillisia sp.]|nr:glycoside hydrolase family 2 TIM barrel-domain containing protein [Gillisia sp.]
MKKILSLLVIIFLSGLPVSCDIGSGGSILRRSAGPRITENYGSSWLFQRQEGKGSKWEKVNLPHTVKIEPLVVNNQWQGSSIYRKSFNVGAPDGKKWFFHFEGVMQEARVSINGTEVLIHKGGYLPFTVDATPHLIPKSENRIKVEVINKNDKTIPPGKSLKDLDFNLYGGIYRNVYLIKTNEIYITDPVHADVVNGGGILIHFKDPTQDEAKGSISTHIQNDSQKDREIRLKISLEDKNGESVNMRSSKYKIPAGEHLTITEEIIIEEPLLWSPSQPNLYTVKVEVMDGRKVIDRKEIRTGIRSLQLTGTGLNLNGEKIFLNGTNRHQEYPYIGYALSNEAQYRDAYKIKEAGFNFVRLSHYPHATAFLEACDELGLMVMNAIPGWQFYEDGEFAENAIKDIRDMARRDRNHPSVVFWENSLNESEMPEEFMLRANEVLKAELPYENTYTAGWIDHPSYDLFIPARQHAQPPLYWSTYDSLNRPILIAEYGDWEYYAQNAGFNQKAFSDLKEEERTSRQLRGAGEARLLQQALNYQEAFNSNLKGAQTIGHANWLMFDYNRGYANDLEASGISDIFRLPKFSYYFYKSQKPPKEDQFSAPMVFIANYWTPQSTTSIRIFSNTEEIALYLNDELIERKRSDLNEISDSLAYPPFTFELETFQEGELLAVGFINGREVASHSVKTPGKAVKIELEADLSGKNINTAGPDMIFVYAKIVDENGTLVPTANNLVEFRLDGDPKNARIIGGTIIKAEAGIATILLRTENYSGPIKLSAGGSSLGESTITIQNK